MRQNSNQLKLNGQPKHCDHYAIYKIQVVIRRMNQVS